MAGTDRREPHGVPRPELAQFPPLAGRHGGRADEPAEAGAVPAEQARQDARVGASGVSGMWAGCNPASPPSSRAQVGLGPMSRTPVRAELKCTFQSVA